MLYRNSLHVCGVLCYKFSLSFFSENNCDKHHFLGDICHSLHHSLSVLTFETAVESITVNLGKFRHQRQLRIGRRALVFKGAVR